MRLKQKQENMSRGGQSIVEYILLVAGMIALAIIFLGRGGVFERSYNSVIQTQGSDLLDMTNRIFP